MTEKLNLSEILKTQITISFKAMIAEPNFTYKQTRDYMSVMFLHLCETDVITVEQKEGLEDRLNKWYKSLYSGDRTFGFVESLND